MEKWTLRDGDGDGVTAAEGDCWDNAVGPAGSELTGEQINPDAEETWYDNVDQNCDGTSDFDADQDGFDADSYGGADCNDTDPTVYPDAEEIWYDGIDSDCAGNDDNDRDGDGYQTADLGGVDCDDGDAGISPVAEEDCDGIDQDCDGQVDEDPVGAETWYSDADGDGYGDLSHSTSSCEAPDGYVANAEDCDDSDEKISPDGAEVCNEKDDNCDHLIDGDDPEITYSNDDWWYPDRDGDTYGDRDASDDIIQDLCTQPPDSTFPSFSYVRDHTDCDDISPTTNPGAIEVCDDDLDSDCDGTDNSGGECE